MYEQLKQIREAEKQADDRIVKAQDEQKNLISRASSDANRLYNQKIEEAQNRAQQLVCEANEQAQAFVEQARADFETQAQAFYQQHLPNMEQAVDFICKKVTGL